MQRITILGSTGSIGTRTLDVIALHPQRYQVFALTAHRRVDLLFAQCRQFNPLYAVVADEKLADGLISRLRAAGLATEVLWGAEGLCQVAADSRVDTVMAAIVGAAGLLPTLAAVRSGKRVLLSNKESLVMSGELFMEAVADSGAQLLPIDSEHNAIFQCIVGCSQNRFDGRVIDRIILTASGGPFRTLPIGQLQSVTPEQACAHPNWEMGRKISVDSASMMNKGLELIEACWLFDATPDQVDIVIHPQSIIHSMVQYVDGSTLAQLGNPDMRTPIAHALAWPERIVSGVPALDLVAIGQLEFSKPDLARYPALALAIAVARAGGGAGAVLNAANEVAVDAFLQRKLLFTEMVAILEQVLEQLVPLRVDSIEQVLEVDRQARQLANEWLKRRLK